MNLLAIKKNKSIYKRKYRLNYELFCLISVYIHIPYIVRRSTVSNVNPTGSARHRTIAVHYTGDTSKYVPVRHERYHGELINYILFS